MSTPNEAESMRAELAKVTAEKTAACDEANGLAEENHALRAQRRDANLEVGNQMALRDEARATAAQHEKALEAMQHHLSVTRELSNRRAVRCAMLTEALDRARRHIAVVCPLHYEDHQNRDGSGRGACYIIGAGTLDVLGRADAALTAPDAGVAEWLQSQLDAEHSRATAACLEVIEGRKGYEPIASALAARDAQVEAKALEKAIGHLSRLSSAFSSPDIRWAMDELRALAGKDGTTP